MGKLRFAVRSGIGIVSLAASLIGVSFAPGSARADVDQGVYTVQAVAYGVFPGANLRGRIQGDELMIRQNNGALSHLRIHSRRNGAVLTGYPGDSDGRLGSRTELYRTRFGYQGVQYSFGVPTGDLILRRSR